MNGATGCMALADFSDYLCTCDPAFTGHDCELPIPCSLAPCGNDVLATCVDSNDYLNYTCICSTSWTGADCDVAVPCAADPCLNSAVLCKDHADFIGYIAFEWMKKGYRVHQVIEIFEINFFGFFLDFFGFFWIFFSIFFQFF